MVFPQIKQLDVQNEWVAKRVLQVQRLAYQVEAELIGFDGIPYLRDTEQTLADTPEIFYGVEEKGELLGVIGFEEYEKHLDICRLVVHPYHFRKGIGRQLIEIVLENHGIGKQVMVHTSNKNRPAIQLYEKLGFSKRGEVEVEPGVCLIRFELPPTCCNDSSK